MKKCLFRQPQARPRPPCGIVNPMSTSHAAPAEQLESITVVEGGAAVVIEGSGTTRRLPARWLRLLSDGATEVDPVSGHRRFDSFAIPAECKVRSADLDEATGSWLIRFEGEVADLPFDLGRLLGATSPEELAGPERMPFSSADAPVRGVDLETLESPAALRSFLDTLLRRGYARIRDVPARASALEAVCRQLRLTRGLLAPGAREEPREGPGASAHGPTLHTDDPFLDPVPGFTLRLCLEPVSASGDEAMVADGLSIADTLAAEEPIAAVELARWPMLFACGGADIDHRRAVPILETATDGSLLRITWNDRVARDFMCPDERLPMCSDAYHSLARIIQREGFRNTFRMKAGDLVIIDNQRVLHGRPGGAEPGAFACGHLDRGDLLGVWRLARSGRLD